MNLPETAGSVSRIHTKLQLLHLAIQLQPHSETWPKTKKNCDIKCALNLNMNQPTFFIRFSGTCWVKGCRLPDAFSSESSVGISTPGRIGVTPGEWLQARSSKCSWRFSKFRAVSKGCWVWERKMPLLNTFWMILFWIISLWSLFCFLVGSY